MDTNNMPINEENVSGEKKKNGLLVSIIISIVITLAILVLLAGATMVLLGKDAKSTGKGNVKRDADETVETFLNAVFELDGKTLVDCVFPEDMLRSVYNASKEEYAESYSDSDFTYEEYIDLLAEALGMSLAWQLENVHAQIQNVEIVAQRQYGQQELAEYTKVLREQIYAPDFNSDITAVCETTVRYQLKETKDSQWEEAEKTITLYECDGCWYVDPNAVTGE